MIDKASRRSARISLAAAGCAARAPFVGRRGSARHVANASLDSARACRSCPEGEKERAERPTVVKNAISSVLKRVRFMGAVKDHAAPMPCRNRSSTGSARFVRSPSPSGRVFVRSNRYCARRAFSPNSRLLYRALEEMTSGPTSGARSREADAVGGVLLAHAADAHGGVAVFGEVAAGRVQGGRRDRRPRRARRAFARRASPTSSSTVTQKNTRAPSSSTRASTRKSAATCGKRT